MPEIVINTDNHRHQGNIVKSGSIIEVDDATATMLANKGIASFLEQPQIINTIVNEPIETPAVVIADKAIANKKPVASDNENTNGGK